jgi:dihydroxyacetone kinase-like protein
MKESISADEVRGALKASITALAEKRKELDRLDAAIGDGDHGRTINTAFETIQPMLASEEKDVGQFLRTMGRTLALSVGAATGPLYGTGIMEAGKAVMGKEQLKLEDVAATARAFEEGVARRGKGSVGEKTMLDTVHPFAEALEKSLADGASLADAMSSSLEAARQGMEATREMVSQRGRSSRLGERSRGHIDPGAASCYYIIQACITYLLSKS